MIKIKRIYEPVAKEDGYRVLVDRLWPRGISKKEARIDLWLKEIAPSTTLRKWFHREPEKWQQFEKRYTQELEHAKQEIKQIKEHAKEGVVTLVYAARD